MKWEYKAVSFNEGNLTEWLNDLGADHWRLVACDLKENAFVFERLAPNVPFGELREDFARENEMVNQALQEYFGGKVG